MAGAGTGPESLWERGRAIVEALGGWAGRAAFEKNTLVQLLGGRRLAAASDDEASARRLRDGLERLGPVFIKLGQLLSTRPDLVSPVTMRTLQRLQDRVAPMSPGEVEVALRAHAEAVGHDPFRSVESAPVAAASLAQVHRARLHDGRSVAVKVRRPGVERRVGLDLKILALAAALAQRHLSRGETYDLPGTVEELSQAFAEELDFRHEAENLLVFRRNLDGFRAELILPEVYLELTTPSVMVMEFIDGQPLSQAPVECLGTSRRETLSRVLTHSYFQQFFLDGIFHADPHPGNVFLTPEGKVALLDFGMVGRIERQVSDNLVRVFLNFLVKDSHGVAHAFLDLGKPTREADEIGWIMDVRRLLPRYHGMRLERLNLGTLLVDLLRCAARNNIQAPPIVALVCKSLANMDGSARHLNPHIDVIGMFRSFLPRVLEEHARRVASVEDAAKVALDTTINVQRAAFQIGAILEKAATGRLRLVVDPLPAKKRRR